MRGKRKKGIGKWVIGLVMLSFILWISSCTGMNNWAAEALIGSEIAEATAPDAVPAGAPVGGNTLGEEDGIIHADIPQAPIGTGALDEEYDEEEVPAVDEDEWKDKKTIALTFDDGPDKKYTEQILDLLKEHNVKATFFLVGLQVDKYPETAKRIVNEGHSIGNHSWSHKDLTKLSVKAREEEMDKAQDAIVEATGEAPLLLRAPYGAISEGVLDSIHARNMKHVYWTVDPRDWAGTSVTDMNDNIMDNIEDGAIILLHSFGGRKHAIENTISLLPDLIKQIRDAGYEFTTVDTLIDADKAMASVIK